MATKQVKRRPGRPEAAPGKKADKQETFYVPPAEAEFWQALADERETSKSTMLKDIAYAAISREEDVRALRERLGLPPLEAGTGAILEADAPASGRKRKRS